MHIRLNRVARMQLPPQFCKTARIHRQSETWLAGRTASEALRRPQGFP
jgi:hypothetical protein